MSSTFSIALSALQAQSAAINTAGNNLANMNTDGFKQSTVNFKDLFSERLGFAGGYNVGLGVSSPISNQLFTQGGIRTSTSPTAAAVQGNGYFVVKTATNQQLYTRDGNFVLDASGALRTETGEAVQGWTATPAGINTNGLPTDITVPTAATLPAVASTTFLIGVNLDSSGVVGSASGSFTQPISVIDSLGDSHTLSINFTKTGANAWSYDVTIPGEDVGGTPGTPQSVLPAPPAPPIAMTFSSSGVWTIAAGATQAIDITGLADGAADMSLTWNLTNSSGVPTITQYATASNSSSPTVDGSAAAQLNQVAIQSGGQVLASFSDGQTKVVGQLALASILNRNSLQNVGNNNFATTSASAIPAIGIPDTGGRGQILGGSLETSNVDMATQLTNLIIYQSAYQASSRVISTAQTLQQDLFQLIR
ncbi:MAG TPA: flagellar hook protein FlgE [Bryobacteraceae bacterium]|nr:flagellar hook protein FlgE [Bryobacteraceae bacterium]